MFSSFKEAGILKASNSLILNFLFVRSGRRPDARWGAGRGAQRPAWTPTRRRQGAASVTSPSRAPPSTSAVGSMPRWARAGLSCPPLSSACFHLMTHAHHRQSRVSDPYSFFTDPDPEDPAGGQYGSGSSPDPWL